MFLKSANFWIIKWANDDNNNDDDDDDDDEENEIKMKKQKSM